MSTIYNGTQCFTIFWFSASIIRFISTSNEILKKSRAITPLTTTVFKVKNVLIKMALPVSQFSARLGKFSLTFDSG